MAKMTFDTTGVDPTSTTGFAPYEGEVPRPGTYLAEIRSVKVVLGKSSGNPYLKVLYVVAGDNDNPKKHAFRGAPIFDNVVPGEHELQQIRLAQLFKAVGAKPKAVIDHDEIDEGGKVNKIGGKDPMGCHVKIVVQADSYNGERAARVSDVFPAPKGIKWPTDDAPVASDDEDAEEAEEVVAEAEEDEAEEEAEETADDAEEAEEDDEEEAEEEDTSEYDARVAELAEMDRAGVKAELKSANPGFTVKKSHTDEELREAVLAAEFTVDDDEESDEEPF